MDLSVVKDLLNKESVILKLIDKLSDAAGWALNHKNFDRMAEDEFIKGVQNSDLDPVAKAILIRQSRKILKEQSNQDDIIKIALENLKESATPSNVSNDWISQFMDKARLVSDEEFKILWGNILAEECNTPGSVPKALLHIMEHLDKDTAYIFIKFASVSINYYDGEKVIYSPVIGNIYDTYFEEKGFKYDDLVELKATGLIEYDLVGGYYQTSTENSITVNYFDESYTFDVGIDRFNVGQIIYTKAGNALCKAIIAEKIEGFFKEKCISILKESI